MANGYPNTSSINAALAVDLPPSELLSLISGLTENVTGQPTVSAIPLPGGPEYALREIARSSPFDAFIGSFVGTSWLDAVKPGLFVFNINTLSELEGIPNAGFNWRKIGQDASRALRAQGVEDLAVAGVPGQHAVRQVHSGFQDENANIQTVPVQSVLLQDWLKGLERPTGLFAYSPNCTAYIVRLALSLGLNIPEDLAILTVGDTTLASIQAGIELATIRLPYDDFGRALAHSLSTGGSSGSIEVEAGKLQPAASLLRAKDSNPAFERLLATLEWRLAEYLPVHALAHEAGMSRRSFELKFRQRTGESPGRHIGRLRMEKARDLLRGTDLGVGRVGQRCGYAEVYTFSAAFKKHFGKSPSRMRAS